MTEVQLPTIGRVIHYCDAGANHLAAIVIDTWHTRFLARVLVPNRDAAGDYERMLKATDYNTRSGPFTWHWPERERSPETEVTDAVSRQKVRDQHVVQDVGWGFGDQS